jgi:hypothetical protein
MMLLSARYAGRPEVNCVDTRGEHISGFHLIGFNENGSIYLYTGVDALGGFELIEEGKVILTKEP